MVLYILGLLYIVIGAMVMIHYLKKVHKHYGFLDDADVIFLFFIDAFLDYSSGNRFSVVHLWKDCKLS